MNSSNFRKLVMYIENTQPDLQLNNGFTGVQIIASGVCINAPPSFYPGLNPLLSYEICAAILTVCWESWSKFKETGVLSLK